MSKLSKNMNEFNKKASNAGNRFSGGMKKVAGKITGNEQLELKGRIQAGKAKFKENMSMKDNVNDVKETIAEKINDRLDKKEK